MEKQLSQIDLDDLDDVERKALTTELSRKAIARLFRTTKQNVALLERNGHLQLNPNGKLPLWQAVAQWDNYQKVRKTSARLEDDAEIRRLKIEAMQLTSQQRKGILVSKEWVKNHYLYMIGQLAVRIQSIPSRFTRELKERARLQAMIDEVFAWFAHAIDELAEEDA